MGQTDYRHGARRCVRHGRRPPNAAHAAERTAPRRLAALVRFASVLVAASAPICIGGGCATLCGWVSDTPVCRYYARIPLDADKDAIVAALNANIAPVVAWRCRRASVTARQDGRPPVLLSAQVAVARPRRLRVIASLLGRDEIDIGSNDREFWCWVRRNDPPLVLTGLHDDPRSTRRIPFRPEWLMEALGVIPLDPQDYRVEHSAQPRYVFLVDDRATIAGQPVYRVLTVDLYSGVIVAHTVYDRAGQVLLRARLEDFRTDAGTGATLPHRVTLEWPAAGITLAIGLGEIEVNPAEIPETVWRRPAGGVR